MVVHFNHPGHNHTLHWYYWLNYDRSQLVGKKCNGCMREVSDGYGDGDWGFYRCPEKGCEFYLHSYCGHVGGRSSYSEVDHPLHPQHPLTLQFNNPPSNNDNKTEYEFVCSFCQKTKTTSSSSSGGCVFLLHCAKCPDFYLDFICSRNFEQNHELLLTQYQFHHFFHPHQNHKLLPHFFPYEYEQVYNYNCQGCGLTISGGDIVFKCIGSRCEYYLHVPCSRVPKEMKHPFHPQHTLTLLETPLLPDDDDDSQKKVLHCSACLSEMKDDVFVLHCNQCHPSFDLDIACAFREPTVKYERHDHLLALYDRINTKLVDVSPCAACNTECDVYLYRCFGCDFNIHSQCLNLPLTVDFDDHVHPFTLVNSLNEDESGMYQYCDICEERREANHGLYVCQGCPSFVSHFECVLSPSYTDEKDQTWMRRKDREYREIEKKAEPKTPTLELFFDEKAATVIFSQLGMEIKKIGETVKELLEETHRKEVTEKLVKIKHSHAHAQFMLRQLRERRIINSN